MVSFLRAAVMAAWGAICAAFAYFFGGWSDGLICLIICMAIDYTTGLLVAGVFGASPKSPGGGIESKAAIKGLVRKVFVLTLVGVAHILDGLLATTYVQDAVVIAFCTSEILSIVENAGLMGVPLPAALVKAIDLLKAKAEKEADHDGS